MTIVKWKKPSIEGQGTTSPVVFNSPLSGLFENFLGDDFFTREFASYVPAVNFSEGKEHYHLDVSAPGFEKDDFKIELNRGVLTVTGHHKTEKETTDKNYSRKEFNYGSFQRSFTLPEGVNEAGVEAKYDNGILKISLKKNEDAHKGVVEIKVS